MSKKRPNLVCSESTILAVQRLLADAYLAGQPAAHHFTQQHDTVNCNALLDIVDDSEFVDAAFRQVHGREVTDRRHRRWVKRLRIVSRAFMLVCLRNSEVGRQHGVRIPGLWLALLLDQPRRGVFRIPFAGPMLSTLRRRAIA